MTTDPYTTSVTTGTTITNPTTMLTQKTLSTELSRNRYLPILLPTQDFKILIKVYFGTDKGKKKEIVEKYGPISLWDTSKVTDMSVFLKKYTIFLVNMMLI